MHFVATALCSKILLILNDICPNSLVLNDFYTYQLLYLTTYALKNFCNKQLLFKMAFALNDFCLK